MAVETLPDLLPEILEHIFCLCTHEDLVNIACCNSMCYDAVVCSLFRNVKIYWEKLNRKLKDTNIINFRYTTTLHFSHEYVHLSYNDGNCRNEKWDNIVENYWLILKACDNLKELKFTGPVPLVVLSDHNSNECHTVTSDHSIESEPFIHLEKLFFKGCNIRTVDDSLIKAFGKQYTELTMSNVEITLSCWDYISSMQQLKKLVFKSNCWFDRFCIGREPSNLTYLDLSKTNVTDINLRSICSSSIKLQTLIISKCLKIGALACSYIAMQRSLNKLVLSVVEILEGFHVLRELTNLTYLDLSETQLNDNDLKSICSSSIKLQTLVISKCWNIGHLACSYIAKQSSIKRLEFSGVDIEGFNDLRELSNLTYLDLSETPLNDYDLEFICISSIKLQTLIMSECDEVGDMACEYISMQKSLRKLDIHYTSIKQGFHNIAKLRNLTYLDLSCTRVRIADIESICLNCVRLKTLTLEE